MGHPVLRERARPLDKSEIKGAVVQKLIDDMIDTMREYHGVGLAGPQVHEPLRLFVALLDEEPDEKGSPHLMPRTAKHLADHRGAGAEQCEDDEPRDEDRRPAAERIEIERRRHRILRHRTDRGCRQPDQAVGRKPRPRSGPRDDDQDDDDVGAPRSQRSSRVDGDVGCRLRTRTARDRHASECADGFRPPDLGKAEQDPERRERPGNVRQVRTEKHRHGPLAGDIRQRPHAIHRQTVRPWVPSRRKVVLTDL